MESWSNLWEKVDDHENGGQSKTYFVKEKNSTSSPLYVLKELNRQKDLDRRKRMYREYAILRTLDSPRIPKAIYSNSEQFNVLEEKLYIVMELINGITLETAIQNGCVADLEDIIHILHQLLETLDLCHNSAVIHRDIKPDNIVLRNNCPRDIVLLDFGQSFNEENASESITPDNEIMGNRFLSLPELSICSGAKNDKRSDITMAFGIFFYSLTKIFPRVLSDQDGKLPHQRHTIQIEGVNNRSLSLIIIMLDIAFQPKINDRYQSVSTAMADLEELHASLLTNQSDTTEHLVNKFLSERTSTPFNNTRELVNIIETCSDIIHRMHNEAFNQLGSDFSIIQGKLIRDYEKLIGGKTYTIHDKIKRTLFSFMVCAIITGDELVFISKQIPAALDDTVDYARGEQIYRCGLNSINMKEIQAAIGPVMLSRYMVSASA